MIGGSDHIFKTSAPTNAIQAALRIAALFWPNALAENAETGQRFFELSKVPIGELPELLIYKDKSAMDQWHQLGADVSLDGTMVHVLPSNTEIAVVVDDVPSGEIREILKSLRDAIQTSDRISA